MKPITLLAAALCVAATSAAAQDYPKLKPGLWEVASRTSAQAKDDPPLKSSMCLDDATAREMYNASQGMMSGMCSKFDVKQTGNRYTSEAECKLGQSKMVARSTMTLSGDASYRIEGTSTFDPPFMGMKEATTTVEARHAGPCKPGQKPGDITTAAGQTINIRNLPTAPKK
ncbi:MAG: DUF3617 family protein [Betaproteobacteria bacterium]